MADQVTCCPHCNTSFRITDTQLASAKGAVRCGSCLQVFKAIDHLAAQQSDARTDETYDQHQQSQETGAESKPSETTDRQPPTSETARDAVDDEMLISDDMDDENTSASENDFSAEFLVESRSPQTQGAMFDRQINPSQKIPPNDQDDDSWAEALLDEEPQATNTSARQEPIFTITGDSDDDLLGEQHLEELHFDEDLKAAEQHQPKNEQIISGIADAPVELEWHSDQSPWPRRILWGGLNTLALIALTVQIGWFHFDNLSRTPPYRGVYQSLCPMIGCELPPKYDTTMIKSYNLVVRSHPKAQNALAIDSILLNTASFTQPFPKLTLVFSDINDSPIAHRTFEPSEYLAGELAGVSQMPSQRPVHIALEILDPGVKAVNYQLAIFDK